MQMNNKQLNKEFTLAMQDRNRGNMKKPNLRKTGLTDSEDDDDEETSTATSKCETKFDISRANKSILAFIGAYKFYLLFLSFEITQIIAFCEIIAFVCSIASRRRLQLVSETWHAEHNSTRRNWPTKKLSW